MAARSAAATAAVLSAFLLVLVLSAPVQAYRTQDLSGERWNATLGLWKPLADLPGAAEAVGDGKLLLTRGSGDSRGSGGFIDASGAFVMIDSLPQAAGFEGDHLSPQTGPANFAATPASFNYHVNVSLSHTAAGTPGARLPELIFSLSSAGENSDFQDLVTYMASDALRISVRFDFATMMMTFHLESISYINGNSTLDASSAMPIPTDQHWRVHLTYDSVRSRFRVALPDLSTTDVLTGSVDLVDLLGNTFTPFLLFEPVVLAYTHSAQASIAINSVLFESTGVRPRDITNFQCPIPSCDVVFPHQVLVNGQPSDNLWEDPRYLLSEGNMFLTRDVSHSTTVLAYDGAYHGVPGPNQWTDFAAAVEVDMTNDLELQGGFSIWMYPESFTGNGFPDLGDVPPSLDHPLISVRVQFPEFGVTRVRFRQLVPAQAPVEFSTSLPLQPTGLQVLSLTFRADTSSWRILLNQQEVLAFQHTPVELPEPTRYPGMFLGASGARSPDSEIQYNLRRLLISPPTSDCALDGVSVCGECVACDVFAPVDTAGCGEALALGTPCAAGCCDGNGGCSACSTSTTITLSFIATAGAFALGVASLAYARWFDRRVLNKQAVAATKKKHNNNNNNNNQNKQVDAEADNSSELDVVALGKELHEMTQRLQQKMHHQRKMTLGFLLIAVAPVCFDILSDLYALLTQLYGLDCARAGQTVCTNPLYGAIPVARVADPVQPHTIATVMYVIAFCATLTLWISALFTKNHSNPDAHPVTKYFQRLDNAGLFIVFAEDLPEAVALLVYRLVVGRFTPSSNIPLPLLLSLLLSSIRVIILTIGEVHLLERRANWLVNGTRNLYAWPLVCSVMGVLGGQIVLTFDSLGGDTLIDTIVAVFVAIIPMAGFYALVRGVRFLRMRPSQLVEEAIAQMDTVLAKHVDKLQMTDPEAAAQLKRTMTRPALLAKPISVPERLDDDVTVITASATGDVVIPSDKPVPDAASADALPAAAEKTADESPSAPVAESPPQPPVAAIAAPLADTSPPEPPVAAVSAPLADASAAAAANVAAAAPIAAPLANASHAAAADAAAAPVAATDEPKPAAPRRRSSSSRRSRGSRNSRKGSRSSK